MTSLPGLSFKLQGRPAEPSPLHTDVAGFVGRTRRGPRLDGFGRLVATRVEGWRRFVRDFGGLAADLTLGYALRGYFANGGQVAYVVRVNGGEDRAARSDVWDVSSLLPPGSTAPPRYRFVASSAGAWGKVVRVEVRSRTVTRGRRFIDPGRAAVRSAAIDLVVSAPGDATEYLTGLDPTITDRDEGAGRGLTLAHRVEQDSVLLRLEPTDEPAAEQLSVFTLRLDGAAERAPSLSEYLDAVQALGDEPEVALMAVPSIEEDLQDPAERWEVVRELLAQAASHYDRQVLVDPPSGVKDPKGFAQLLGELREDGSADASLKCGSLYAPWLRVPDPFGGTARPLRRVPPSGHVAGVISRIDRERGAHFTPANALMLDAVDLETPLDPGDEGDIAASGVNLIVCRRARGLVVWGGRTLDPRGGARYLAHRRLVHRLVRAFRRVAEPIVFESNGPGLRLSLARAMTSVLLDAYRAGALKGDRPEDAFRVQCDESNNPPGLVDQGMAICSIAVAPAVPMEFITLRVALSETKQLEVFDT